MTNRTVRCDTTRTAQSGAASHAALYLLDFCAHSLRTGPAILLAQFPSVCSSIMNEQPVRVSKRHYVASEPADSRVNEQFAAASNTAAS